MASFPPSMQKLVRELTRLPSIGEKSAVRLAYHILTNDLLAAKNLAEAIVRAAESVRLCRQCFHLTESDLCPVCEDLSRDSTLICVVEKPSDLLAFERMGEYKGLYHVLHGVWAPLRGQGLDSIRLNELLDRVKRGGVNEVIIATSATVEGDATALYTARELAQLGAKVSRLAQGIPKGGELEYADDVTLARAFSGRANFTG